MKWKFDLDGTDFTDRLTNLTQVKVFKEMVHTCNKDTLRWYHTKEERERISKKLKVSEITVKKVIKGIEDSKLIQRIGRGEYKLNSAFITYGQHGNNND